MWPVYADGRGRRHSLPFCRRPDGKAIGKGHGVGRRLPWANFADGRTLPMAWPSAKISICRWLGFADGFAVGKDRLWRWPVFADVWTVGKISLPMALLCHRQILWSADGLFSGHRQTSRPSANKPFPVVPVGVPRLPVRGHRLAQLGLMVCIVVLYTLQRELELLIQPCVLRFPGTCLF